MTPFIGIDVTQPWRMIRFSMRHLVRLVTSALVSLSLSAAASAGETPATAPALAPGIKDFGIKDYLRVSRALPHSQDTPWRLVCTLPENCHFQPVIEVAAEAGKTILFDSTNPLVRYLVKTESVITAAGSHTYEAKNWISGEGAIYTIPAGVSVKSVSYRETGYDTTFAGSFHCNDEDYN